MLNCNGHARARDAAAGELDEQGAVRPADGAGAARWQPPLAANFFLAIRGEAGSRINLFSVLCDAALDDIDNFVRIRREHRTRNYM